MANKSNMIGNFPVFRIIFYYIIDKITPIININYFKIKK